MSHPNPQNQSKSFVDWTPHAKMTLSKNERWCAIKMLIFYGTSPFFFWKSHFCMRSSVYNFDDIWFQPNIWYSKLHVECTCTWCSFPDDVIRHSVIQHRQSDITSDITATLHRLTTYWFCLVASTHLDLNWNLHESLTIHISSSFCHTSSSLYQ